MSYLSVFNDTPPRSYRKHMDVYETPARTSFQQHYGSSRSEYGLSNPRSSYFSSGASSIPRYSSGTALTPSRSQTPVRVSLQFRDDSPPHSSERWNSPQLTPMRRPPSSLSYETPNAALYPTRAPSSLSCMVTDACTTFIPPQRAEDRGKPVIVLDLDETLIYARDGPVISRPGLQHLLRVLHGRCEVVVWTAGEREYALDAIRQIDPHRSIQHCVYRHRKWWTGQAGYTKDLTALGRPLERTLLIDNTPDCTRANPLNAILVKDFHGDCRLQDQTMYHLADIFEAIIQTSSHRHHISDILNGHPHIALRDVPCDASGAVTVFTLAQDVHPAVYSSTNFDLRQSERTYSSVRR